MELKIYSPDDNGYLSRIEWNYEEIKAEVAGKIEHYKTLVYTDDQITEAKADRAKLNKFVLALDERRKEIKKRCLEPYEAFEKQIADIKAIIAEPIGIIDRQIKEAEEQKKALKKTEIERLFDAAGFQSFVTLDMIWDPKWLNASVSLKKAEDAMTSEKYRIGSDVQTIHDLPEYRFECLDIYKRTLRLDDAMREYARLTDLAKRKAEAEQREQREQPKQTEQTEQPKQTEQTASTAEQVREKRWWVSFRANLTKEDAAELKSFFDNRGIEFHRV